MSRTLASLIVAFLVLVAAHVAREAWTQRALVKARFARKGRARKARLDWETFCARESFAARLTF